MIDFKILARFKRLSLVAMVLTLASISHQSLAGSNEACNTKLKSIVGTRRWNDFARDYKDLCENISFQKNIFNPKFEVCFQTLAPFNTVIDLSLERSGILRDCQLEKVQDLAQNSDYQYCLRNYRAGNSTGGRIRTCTAVALQRPAVVDCLNKAYDDNKNINPLDSICPCLTQINAATSCKGSCSQPAAINVSK